MLMRKEPSTLVSEAHGFAVETQRLQALVCAQTERVQGLATAAGFCSLP